MPYRALTSHVSHSLFKDKINSISAFDEEKEEREAEDTSSPPKNKRRVEPELPFNDVSTLDLENPPPEGRSRRSSIRRKTLTNWEGKKRISLAEKKMHDPEWM